MSDLIDRQAAIAVADYTDCTGLAIEDVKKVTDEVVKGLKCLPSAQPEPHYDEWCTDCKEYDKERHCCPRWNRVIRQTLKDAQPESCEDAVSRATVIAAILEDKIDVSLPGITGTFARDREVHNADCDRFAKIVYALPSAQPVLTCDGCKHIGTYDTDFPCNGCVRREKDYYDPE